MGREANMFLTKHCDRLKPDGGEEVRTVFYEKSGNRTRVRILEAAMKVDDEGKPSCKKKLRR